jgi:hypothetical protein
MKDSDHLDSAADAGERLDPLRAGHGLGAQHPQRPARIVHLHREIPRHHRCVHPTDTGGSPIAQNSAFVRELLEIWEVGEESGWPRVQGHGFSLWRRATVMRNE